MLRRVEFFLKQKLIIVSKRSQSDVELKYIAHEILNLQYMKKKFTIVLTVLLMAGMAYDYNHNAAHTNSAGAPDGRTGSPGDNGQTCFTSCHGNAPGNGSGGEQTSVTHDIPASGYVSGTVYNVTVDMTGGGSKFGFSLSAQNASGADLGSLMMGSGTQLNGGGKYVTHTASSNTGSGSKSWAFQWEAPVSGSGPVTFYAASIFADGMSGNSGDYLVLAENATSESSVGISEADLAAVTIYPNPVVDVIHVAAIDVDEEIMITLFNVEGKMVLQQKVQGGDIAIDIASKNLNTGVYFLNLEVDGKSTIKKLLIN